MYTNKYRLPKAFEDALQPQPYDPVGASDYSAMIWISQVHLVSARVLCICLNRSVELIRNSEIILLHLLRLNDPCRER